MLEDHYRNALVRILSKKQGKTSRASGAGGAFAENVVNLMDALRRSIAAEKRPPAKSAFTAQRRKARGQASSALPQSRDESGEGKRTNLCARVTSRM